MSVDNNNASNASNHNAANVGAELAAATIGCRIKFSWLGTTRSLDDSQNEQASALFNCDAEFLKSTKKLFDNNRPEYRAVNRVKTAIRSYWNDNTLPFTEPGVRLLRRSSVAEFSAKMESFASELAAAVDELDSVYSELLDEARQRLGSLYNSADYPDTLRGAFSVAFDFPNLSPPDYLAQLSPELFEREQRRVAAHFDAAVELAEQSFSAELLAMVERITSTLTGDVDGKPKIFRDSMLENVAEFFKRFRALSIGNSAELAAIVERAEQAIAGVTPAALRSSVHVRDMVRERIAAVQTELESAMVERPVRRIRVGAVMPPATPPVQPPATPPSSSSIEPPATPSVEPANVEPPTMPSVEPAAANVEPSPSIEPAASVAAEPVAMVAEQAAEIEPPATPQVEPATVERFHAEPAPSSATGEPVAFNLNYGGGVVRRLVVAAR